MQYIQLQGQVAADLDSPINGAFNLFIDTADGTIKAKDSDGNLTSAGGGLVETTYSELSASFVDATLTPGTYYKITDFKTCYDQPDYDHVGVPIETGNYKSGSISPIIVFALDSGSLASNALQPDYPNDEIKYDITFDRTEVTNNPAFGRIIYRKDNQGNILDYDFREVYFKRYTAYYSEQVYDGTVSVSISASFGLITGSGTNFTNFSTGNVVGVLDTESEPLVTYYEIVSIEGDNGMTITGSIINEVSDKRLVDATELEMMSWKQNNIPSNSGSQEYLTFDNYIDCFNNVCTNPNQFTLWDEYTFLLPNNVFIGENTYIDNSFVTNFRNNTFNDDCDSNTITDAFVGNIIDDDFDNNIIHGAFNDNIIVSDFQYNVITGDFYNNNLGDDDGGIDFNNNIIKGDFYNNFHIGWDNMDFNTINGNFYKNIILGQFANNTIDHNCYSNYFGKDFNDNKLGADFQTNIIYHYFNGNTIGRDFENNNIGTFDYDGQYFEHNEIGAGMKGNYILGGFYENKIGVTFYSNEIADNFVGNIIGNYFLTNDILDNFENNVIQNWFEGNNIGNNFKYNKIGNNFYDNTIGDDFGFGGGTYRGNVIGNGFQSNTIGEYFYDNSIGDNFTNNTIGEYFQFNRIDTSLDTVDFTEYYGNLTSVSFPNDIPGTDGTYSGITGETSGTGVNAEFEIIVTGNLVTTVNITNSGKMYHANDTITIASGSFGGTADLVLTEDGLSATPMVYQSYNKTIQTRFDGTPVLLALTDMNEWYASQYITQPID